MLKSKTPLLLTTAACRSFHTTRITPRGRNVLAKFAPPPIPPTRNHSAPIIPRSIKQIPAAKRDEAFETAATAPVGASLQETPPPDSKFGTKLAVKLPAMTSPDTDTQQSLAAATPSSSSMVGGSTKEIRVAGVLIPSKPVPPGEEECCMSGCVHCVYTIYADEMEEYTSALEQAKSALEKDGVPLLEWPEQVATLARKEEAGAGGAETMKKEAKVAATKGLDPSLAAFLALENKLKTK